MHYLQVKGKVPEYCRMKSTGLKTRHYNGT
jgi:hypothetical protein